MTDCALDTSAAVPFLLRSHPAHGLTDRTLAGRSLVLTGHALAETYSVLTRLPGDARLAPMDAATLIEGNFGAAVLVEPATAAGLPARLARLGVAGGAVYDALVALAAMSADLVLVTRDARAADTYQALGAEIELIDG